MHIPKINILFSMLGPRFSEQEAAEFSEYGKWVVLNEHNGRVLIDALALPDVVSFVKAKLQQMDRDPIVIGIWRQLGDVSQSLDLDAWLDVAPDIVEYSDDPDEEPTRTRPTEFIEAHRWAGWKPKRLE